MYRELAGRAESLTSASTLNAVFDRYLVERLPQLAPRTQRDYQGYIQNLRRVFGTAPPSAVNAGHVFDYRNKRAEKSVVQANREKSCLSAVFTAAVEWRIVNENPCRQVPKIEEPARDRYVTDGNSQRSIDSRHRCSSAPWTSLRSRGSVRAICCGCRARN